MKKLLVIFSIVILATCFLYFNPSLFFKYNLKYKNFYLYSDRSISDSAYSMLDEVEELVTQSSLYDPSFKFKIFVRSDFINYSLIPGWFNASGLGQVVVFGQNIFISKVDFGSNLAFTSRGTSRALAKTIAHELTHILIYKNSYINYFLSFLKKTNFSDFGLFWKDEGYAEYISKAWDDDDLALSVLSEEEPINCSVYAKEYCKYWIAVKYLIENKHMTIAEILKANIVLKDVLSEIKSFKEEGNNRETS